MRKLGFVVWIGMLLACNDAKKPEAATVKEEGFSVEALNARFAEEKTPWQISDTTLQQPDDTSTLRQTEFAALLPDSLKQSIFGRQKVRFSPLARFRPAEGDLRYFVVRAASERKSAALLYVFDGKGVFQALFPLLVPDTDDATLQVSSVDRSMAITRNITKKLPKDESAEGKDVFSFNPADRSFTLIMTDPLEDRQDVLNPIDTFSRKHPLAGDYVRNQRNFVSVRDARTPNELQFFIHFEKDKDCGGELRGTALLTSSRMAVYRQGGDPCVLELSFSGNSVSVREVEGCGSRRGVKCVFDGSFPKKKEARAKNPGKSKPKK